VEFGEGVPVQRGGGGHRRRRGEGSGEQEDAAGARDAGESAGAQRDQDLGGAVAGESERQGGGPVPGRGRGGHPVHGHGLVHAPEEADHGETAPQHRGLTGQSQDEDGRGGGDRRGDEDRPLGGPPQYQRHGGPGDHGEDRTGGHEELDGERAQPDRFAHHGHVRG